MASILVVDDLEDLTATLRRALELSGYDVSTSADGEKAIKILHEESFDLVILDVHLPGRDGLEVIRDMRTARNTAKILAISGGGQKGDFLVLDVAEKMGANASLRKPFSLSELLPIVEQLIRES